MEGDFHHGTTYVLSRMAGFKPEEAYVIAYSAEYVDQAGSNLTESVEYHAIFFDDYGIFEYIDSCHGTFDVENIKEVEQHNVWVPFHFIPGNKSENNKLVERLICQEGTEDNQIVQEMIKETLRRPFEDAGLHRLGITMHVLADTFAHRGFAGIMGCLTGIMENVNDTSNIKIISPENFAEPSSLVYDYPPLGHARAGHLPDYPFLDFEYVNYNNEKIRRNNPEDFLTAAKTMLNVLNEYREKYYPSSPVPSKEDVQYDLEKIHECFKTFVSDDCNKRHQMWIDKINGKEFKCCNSDEEKALYFAEDQPNSWWHEVTQICPHSDNPLYNLTGYRKFDEKFMKCNYRLFQLSLKAHRYYVQNVILPNFGICIA